MLHCTTLVVIILYVLTVVISVRLEKFANTKIVCKFH